MAFKCNIKTTNAAFADDDLIIELTRILREIAKKIEIGHTGGKCQDINGNTVGEWSIGR